MHRHPTPSCADQAVCREMCVRVARIGKPKPKSLRPIGPSQLTAERPNSLPPFGCDLADIRIRQREEASAICVYPQAEMKSALRKRFTWRFCAWMNRNLLKGQSLKM